MQPQCSFAREGMGPNDRISRSEAEVSRPRSEESWIEVSSAASSSSTSIHTEQRPFSHTSRPPRRRRRLLRNAVSGPVPTTRPRSATTSSQEEYEESSSESDRMLTSSNEHISDLEAAARLAAPSSSDDASSNAQSQDDDEDESGTALGVGTNNSHTFAPPANAFSHPPTYTSSRQTRSLGDQRPTYPSTQAWSTSRRQTSTYPRQGNSHSPYNAVAPNHRVDHDAALRASLTTLLSCAAAARSLPTKDRSERSRPTRTGPSNAIQPSTLRLVPESALSDEEKGAATRTRQRSQESKRKLSASKERRSKKLRAQSPVIVPPPSSNVQKDGAIASPTIASWIMNAGVLVLFSAISFSAGYAIGREAMRLELVGPNNMQINDLRSSGRDMAGAGIGVSRGLKKLRSVSMITT